MLATLDGPTGKRLAPALPKLLAALRRHGELTISDQVAELLVAMSAATIDRGLPRPGRQAQGHLPHQAGVAAEVPDPDAHLGPTGIKTSPGSSRSTWSATRR